MNERQFQGWIVEVAERFGWRVLHVPFPVRAVGGGRFVPESRARGLPDLILIHDDPPRLVFAEVKAEKGTISPAQAEVLRAVRAVGEVSLDGESPVGRQQTLAAYVWAPGQEDAIEGVLRTRVLS